MIDGDYGKINLQSRNLSRNLKAVYTQKNMPVRSKSIFFRDNMLFKGHIQKNLFAGSMSVIIKGITIRKGPIVGDFAISSGGMISLDNPCSFLIVGSSEEVIEEGIHWTLLKW